MDYDIREAFEAIENELIESMMRNFSRHRAEEDAEGYRWSQWQALQLQSLEKYRKTNATKFNKQFSTINAKVTEMLKIVREDGNADQEVSILEAIQNGFKVPDVVPDSMTGEFFKVNDRKLDALIKATTDDLQQAETAILRRANDQYRSAIFNAQVYANTGAGTYAKAVDMACRDMLRSGLSCVEYSNGAIHQLSDYADMAIKTANKRAYLYGEGEKRQEWGISTVVVNSRQGGCSHCAKYIGKVFIDDVYSGGKKADGNYPLLSDAIKGGLFHPRCKDSTSTYYEGITTLEPVSKEEMAEMDRREKLEEQHSYYENQAKKNQRIADFSLDKDNRRAYQTRAVACKQKADEIGEKLSKSLEKTDGSGIIREQSRKPITKIQEDAIRRVPYVEIDGYTIEQCEEIHNQHQELLSYARIHNDSKEVAFVFRNGLVDRKEFIGTDDKLDFGNNLIGTELFVMHNHPRNSSISFDDVVEFIGNSSIKSLSVVKNTGDVEVLTKHKSYNILNLLIDLDRIKKKTVKMGTDAEYRKVVDKFIKKYEGLEVIKWQK